MGLRSQLDGVLPPEVLPYVSDRFEVTGTVAVVALPPLLRPYGQIIARAIVSRRKNITAVLDKQEKTAGDSRTARYRFLLGDSAATIHRESGFSYSVEVGRSFFSTRMAAEHERVADHVRAGEEVYVPFAGVGPFVIPAAARGARVLAAELNPDACRRLRENVRLNRVGDRCRILDGDALAPGSAGPGSFDRLIVPAPYGLDAGRALERLVPLLCSGGEAHWYVFGAPQQVTSFTALFARAGLDTVRHAACGNVAPGIQRWVFDLVRR